MNTQQTKAEPALVKREVGSGDNSASAIASDKVVEINPPRVNQPEAKPHLIQSQLSDRASLTVAPTKNESLASADSQPSGIANLENAQPLDPRSFPHQPRDGNGMLTTIQNVEHLTNSYNILIYYDVIRKKLFISCN